MRKYQIIYEVAVPITFGNSRGFALTVYVQHVLQLIINVTVTGYNVQKEECEDVQKLATSCKIIQKHRK